MPSFRKATVTSITDTQESIQRITVDDEPAFVLTNIIGTVDVGDSVIINTTAVDRNLGSGGYHVVHWNLSRDEFDQPGPGHIMKMRYTSEQIDTGSEEEDIDYDSENGFTDLARMPVVACDLHSQLIPVVRGIHHSAPEARVIYVMDDSASLPFALSRNAATMLESEELADAISAGQAFGAPLEAVSIPSALAIAKVNGADVVIVAPGPGVVGTDSSLGFSSVNVAATFYFTHALAGLPIAALRASTADQRSRHQGISHHSRTVLERLVRFSILAPYPDSDFEPHFDSDHVMPVSYAIPDVKKLLEDTSVTVMGRSVDEDPTFFAYAVAAGVCAGQQLHITEDIASINR